MRANSSMRLLPSGLLVPESVLTSDELDRLNRQGIARRTALSNNVKGTLANDSVLVTPGSGATIATHLIGGKEYQAVVLADDAGHIHGSLETYYYATPTVAVGASKLYFDLFNATGSGKVIDVRGIWIIPATDVALTGALGVRYVHLLREVHVGQHHVLHDDRLPFDAVNGRDEPLADLRQ